MSARDFDSRTDYEDIKKRIMKGNANPKIWIDLDNSPHVPFFVPIIEELEKRGFSLVVTARDCSNVCELVKLFGLKARVVGHHYGRNKIVKIAATCFRALQLAWIAITEKPDLAISHGSRSQLLACALTRIPTLTIFDYEFANFSLLKVLRWIGSNWMMAPELILRPSFVGGENHFLHYPGIKEDVYVTRFKPDERIKAELNLTDDKVIVTVRPPASDAHYFNPESEELFTAAINFLSAQQDSKIILLPRNAKEAAKLRERWQSAFASGKMMIPAAAVDGLNLIWHSDLVISGGGTMNREAAALGVPVYSVYRGRIGAVDRYLAKINRLVLIESAEEVESKILVRRKASCKHPLAINGNALSKIMDNVMLVLKSDREFAT